MSHIDVGPMFGTVHAPAMWAPTPMLVTVDGVIHQLWQDMNSGGYQLRQIPRVEDLPDFADVPVIKPEKKA